MTAWDLTLLQRLFAGLLLASAVCLPVAWVLNASIRRRSAAIRSLVWIAGFALTFLLGFTLPHHGLVPLRILPTQTPAHAHRESPKPNAAIEAPPVTDAPGERIFSEPKPSLEKAKSLPSPTLPNFPGPLTLLTGLWGVGCAALLIRIVFGATSVRFLISRGRAPRREGNISCVAESLHMPRAAHIIIHPDIRSPFSFGFRRGWIVLPPESEEWDLPRLELVLAHEVAHFRRRDGITQLFTQIVTVLCWMNPFAWLALNRFRAICEIAADDEAIRKAGAPEDYAEELLRLVRELPSKSATPLPAIHAGSRHSLRKRVESLLDSDTDRRPLPRALKPLSIAIVLLVALLPLVRLSHAEPAPIASAPDKTTEPPMREIQVSVIDEDGKPVAGAEFKPAGLRSVIESGSWYGWEPPEKYASVRTDAQGIARLFFPAFTTEDVETKTVTGSLSHPDFCNDEVEIEVAAPKPIVMQRGALITIAAADGSAPNLKICADLNAAKYLGWTVDWKPSADFRSVTGRLPAGEYAIRAVGFTDGGSIVFSRPRELNVETGRDQSMAFEMTAEPPIRGALSPNVPRPVSGGRVVVNISTPVHESDDLHCEWRTWGTIAADGSFSLENCPNGDVQLIALCNGFVSKDPNGPQTDLTTDPQIFQDKDRDRIEVAMEKSGDAEITVLTPDGAPISGAKVSFWPNQYLGIGTSLFGAGYDTGEDFRWSRIERKRGQAPSLDTPLWSATTNEQGQADVRGFPQGNISFSVDTPGYQLPILQKTGTARRDASVAIRPGVSTSQTVRMEKRGETSLRAGMKAARDSRPTFSIDNTAPLEDPFPVSEGTGTELTGRVVDEQGNPLDDVLIDAWTWYRGSETHSDKTGHFALRNLSRDRDVEIRISKEDYSPIHITRQPLGALQQDVALSKRPYFEGRVTDSRGKPVANQLIRATCGEKKGDGVLISEVWTETKTDSEGRYRLHLWPDTYRLEVRSKDNEVARLENERLEKDQTRTLDFSLRPGVTFRAKIVDSQSGAPVAGVVMENWRQPGIRGISDENGDVKIDGLFPGSFEFEIKADKLGYRRWWSAQAENEWQRRKVERSGWQRNFDSLEFQLAKGMEPVVIEMEKGVTIRGIVQSPDGKPVPGGTVAPARSGTGNSLTGDTRFSVQTQPDGRFEILLPASNKTRYNLTAIDSTNGSPLRFSPGVLPPIETRPGQVIEDVVITLNPACKVSGKVVDAAGKPVKFRQVRAVAADMLENRYYLPVATTNEDGLFVLSGVRPGKNHIQADPFWLVPTEAPEGTSMTVETSPSTPVENVKLLGENSR